MMDDETFTIEGDRGEFSVTSTGHIFIHKNENGRFVKESTILLTRRDQETLRRALARAVERRAQWDADNGY